MNKWLTETLLQIRERNIRQALSALTGKTLLIYGAGGFGMEMLHILQENGLSVHAFLDRSAMPGMEKKGIPVYPAETAPVAKSKSVVLFSIVMDQAKRKKVLLWLQDLGYVTVLESQALRCLLVQPDDQQGLSTDDYYRSHSAKIAAAEALFQEERSHSIYTNTIYAHATGDYTQCFLYESPMGEQYFPPDIKLTKGYQRFVDCGSYIGDTMEALLTQGERIEACAAFEPDSRNYQRMTDCLQRLQGRIEERWLFPCAVDSESRIRAFAPGTGSGTFCTEGPQYVQTVSLDQAIPDFRPTLIKMDIEGAEPSALCGAKNIIMRDTPDLAICTYHAVNHIWDIPLLLHGWGLGYRFYLRSYNAYTMETVLYATT